MSNTIKITVGEADFSFRSFTDWCNNAQHLFKEARLTSNSAICVDARGRICDSGKEFMRARDEDAFPVVVYRKVIP